MKELTAQEIEAIVFVSTYRQTTLKKDLWRHRIMIAKVWLGIARYDLQQLYEWCLILEKIIQKTDERKA